MVQVLPASFGLQPVPAGGQEISLTSSGAPSGEDPRPGRFGGESDGPGVVLVVAGVLVAVLLVAAAWRCC